MPAKMFDFSKWDKKLSKALASADDLIREQSGAEIVTEELAEGEIAIYPTIPISELTDKAIEDLVRQASEGIGKEAKRNGAKRMSPVLALSAHKPDKLRAGWVLVSRFET